MLPSTGGWVSSPDLLPSRTAAYLYLELQSPMHCAAQSRLGPHSPKCRSLCRAEPALLLSHPRGWLTHAFASGLAPLCSPTSSHALSTRSPHTHTAGSKGQVGGWGALSSWNPPPLPSRGQTSDGVSSFIPKPLGPALLRCLNEAH